MSAAAMKLNMIVVMTMWLPRLACRQAGMKRPGRAEERRRPGSASGSTTITRQARVERQGDQRDAEAADIGLALAADVEQAGMEGDRDGEAGEDEVGGVVEREADALGRAEGAVDQDHDRVGAGSRRSQSTTRPATSEGGDEVDQRQDRR